MRRGVQVTIRDRELFALLAKARWLSTSQIGPRFFPDKAANAVNKRMRKLVQANLLRVVRPGLAEEQWYRLATPALGYLDDDNDVTLPRRFPTNLAHFARINDVRLWFERQQKEYGLARRAFVAEWELRLPDQVWDVIPDAVALLYGASGSLRLAIEVDCSTENPSVLASKMRRYGALTDASGAPAFQAVVILVLGWRRLRAVVKVLYGQAAPTGPRCLLADLERLSAVSIQSRAFLDLDAVADGGDTAFVSVADLLRMSCRPVLATGEVNGCNSLSSWGLVSAADSASTRNGERRD